MEREGGYCAMPGFVPVLGLWPWWDAIQPPTESARVGS